MSILFASTTAFLFLSALLVEGTAREPENERMHLMVDMSNVTEKESECVALSWEIPPAWYAGSRVYRSYMTIGCTELRETSLYYSCDLIQPFTLCDLSQPNGSIDHVSCFLLSVTERLSRWLSRWFSLQRSEFTSYL